MFGILFGISVKLLDAMILNVQKNREVEVMQRLYPR